MLATVTPRHFEDRAVKEYLWPACLRKHVRCDGITSSVSSQCLDRLRIQFFASVHGNTERSEMPPATGSPVLGVWAAWKPASLGVNPDGSVLTVGAKHLRFFRTCNKHVPLYSRSQGVSCCFTLTTSSHIPNKSLVGFEEVLKICLLARRW